MLVVLIVELLVLSIELFVRLQILLHFALKTLFFSCELFELSVSSDQFLFQILHLNHLGTII